MGKHKKGYYPRCCNKPMICEFNLVGKTGKNGGQKQGNANFNCPECGNNIRG